MAHSSHPFDDVADWCESHLEEKLGREIGMTFGSLLRTFGRLAATSTDPDSECPRDPARQLEDRADMLLLSLATRYLVAFSPNRMTAMAEPSFLRTNMTYDPAPR